MSHSEKLHLLTYLYVLSRLTIPSMEAFFKHISWHFSLWNTKLHKHFNASTDASLLHSTLWVPMLAMFNKQSNWSTVAWLKLTLLRLNIRTDAKHCGKILGCAFVDFKMLKILFHIRGHWPDCKKKTRYENGIERTPYENKMTWNYLIKNSKIKGLRMLSKKLVVLMLKSMFIIGIDRILPFQQTV